MSYTVGIFSLSHEIVFKRNIFNVCFLCMEWPLGHSKQVRILSMFLYAFPYCRKIIVDVHNITIVYVMCYPGLINGNVASM